MVALRDKHLHYNYDFETDNILSCINYENELRNFSSEMECILEFRRNAKKTAFFFIIPVVNANH